MLKFEDVCTLKPGDTIYQHVGWHDGKPVSFIGWEVTAVHPNSIDIHCPRRVWDKHSRCTRSDFPLHFWSLTQE